MKKHTHGNSYSDQNPNTPCAKQKGRRIADYQNTRSAYLEFHRSLNNKKKSRKRNREYLEKTKKSEIQF